MENGGEGVADDHQDLYGGRLRSPSPEKTPRGRLRGSDCAASEPELSAMLVRGGDPRRPGSPTRPPSTTPVPDCRGGATQRWGNEGADHYDLTPADLRPPSPKKSAPRAGSSGDEGKGEPA